MVVMVQLRQTFCFFVLSFSKDYIIAFDFYFILNDVSSHLEDVLKLGLEQLIIGLFSYRIERLELFDEFEEWHMMQVLCVLLLG